MKDYNILKNADWLIVNVNGSLIFNGLVNDFEAKNSISIPFNALEYNPLTGVCIVDGLANADAPVAVCDAIVAALGVVPNEIEENEPAEQFDDNALSGLPTQLDRIEAQVIFTALMTDTLIEEVAADV